MQAFVWIEKDAEEDLEERIRAREKRFPVCLVVPDLFLQIGFDHRLKDLSYSELSTHIIIVDSALWNDTALVKAWDQYHRIAIELSELEVDLLNKVIDSWKQSKVEVDKLVKATIVAEFAKNPCCQ